MADRITMTDSCCRTGRQHRRREREERGGDREIEREGGERGDRERGREGGERGREGGERGDRERGREGGERDREV